jgi:D-alanine-D-alanine ligase
MVFSSDKHLMSETLRAVGVPTATEVLLHRDDILKGAIEVPVDFPFPGFLKTRLNGGSVGIMPGGANIVASREQIDPHFREVIAGFTPDDVRGENMDEWLLQEFLPGTEWSVGIVGNGEELDILPIGQLEIASNVLDYGTSAEVASGSESNAPPPERYGRALLKPADEQALITSAKIAYATLACRDYARFDFRKDRNGVIKLIDGNVLPGIYHGCAFAAMAAMRGQSFGDLMREILGRCFDRCFPGWRSQSERP